MTWQGCELDHIVIVAPTLTDGEAWVRAALGVAPQPGGAHARMGTHNLLLRLGDKVYLEIIAVDSDALAPDRPRWFGMDVARGQPELVTWVARTNDLEAAIAACPESPGEILPMTRGALSWRITVPTDGSMPGGGVHPTLIQWDTPQHPAAGLQDVGARLAALTVVHGEANRGEGLLRALRMSGPVTVRQTTPGEAPHLEAHIDTPLGARVLRAARFGEMR